MKKRLNEKMILLVIFLMAASLRLVANMVREEVVFKKPFIFSRQGFYDSWVDDERWYAWTARAFLEGKGVNAADINLGHPEGAAEDVLNNVFIKVKKVDGRYYAHNVIPPVYPLFLAACFAIGGMNTLAYLIPQAILGSLTCILIYFLAKEIYGSGPAVLAGFLTAVYPDLVFWTYRLRSETLFIFLLSLGFLLLIRGNIRGEMLSIAAGAFILAMAGLTRITIIPFLPVIVLWQFLFLSRDKYKNIKSGLITVITAGLIFFPWAMRNLVVFGKFTPLSDEVTVVSKGPTGEDRLKGEAYTKRYGSLVTRFVMLVKDDPAGYCSSFCGRFFRFWSPVTASMKTFAKIYKGITWLFLFPLAFAGAVFSGAYWRRCGLLMVFILYYSLLHAATVMDSGLVYRYPAQPFICIFTAFGFWFLYRRFWPHEDIVDRSAV